MHSPRRRLPHFAFPILIAAFIWAAESVHAEPVLLEQKGSTFSIDPQTLEVVCTPENGPALVVSSPRFAPAAVTELHANPRTVRWIIPTEKLSVEMGFDGDALLVQFTAAQPGSLTWPLIAPQREFRAWILPTFEGLYIPADDAQWVHFLHNHGPLNTTSDLSMPFWGIDCGTHTLTYLLDNQFNNELAFQDQNGRLTARFTHTFTSNHNVHEYAVRIYLGTASPVEPARVYRRHLVQQRQFIPYKEKIERTPAAAKLLGAAHVYLWGDGLTPTMLQTLSDAGLDRLWLGSPDWAGLKNNLQAVQKAKSLGYLIGPYDSFHSIHSPTEGDTWETAQFDLALYENGAVVNADGSKKKGFKQKGFILNSAVARPHVEKRVTGLMQQVQCNSWFIDCDADGELFDDYSSDHPATQRDDMAARLSRMAWIRDEFGAVIGSERGSSYAAATIHFAHGMMTPVIGWGDPDLKDRASPYFLGGYYPPDRPAVFFKQVPMKPEHSRIYADPRFRLPLYQIVFHDSLITTHQWGYGSLKFTDEDHSRALLELLYNVPPLYHLNLAEWKKRKEQIIDHYVFFSPLHRMGALLPMTDFRWLSDDHLVQQTSFADDLQLVANFSASTFVWNDVKIPARSVLAKLMRSGKVQMKTLSSPP